MRARALVFAHGWNAVAYQILNPGMRRWFAAAGDAVVGYVVATGVRVVAGAPVCALDRLAAVVAEFEADARAAGARVLYFGAGARLEALLAARGDYALVRLGAQPSWDPARWDAVVRGKASLRAQVRRAANKGVRVEEWGAARARAEEPALRRVLDAWLATRGLPALGFLTAPDLLGHLDDRRLFVAARGADEPLAYLVATPVPARAGWLVEQWPRAPAAPNGTTHLLVDAAMRAVAADGARYVTLGLAPLAARPGGEGAAGRPPAWLRGALGAVRAHGRRFYNFAGLEAFKASLQPEAWEPIYAAADGRRFTVWMLRAVAGAFSDGAPERFVLRAVAGAAREEARRLAARAGLARGAAAPGA